MACEIGGEIERLNKVIKALRSKGETEEATATEEYRNMLVQNSYLQDVIMDGKRLVIKGAIDKNLEADAVLNKAIADLEVLDEGFKTVLDRAISSKLKDDVSEEDKAKGYIYKTYSKKAEEAVLNSIEYNEDQIIYLGYDIEYNELTDKALEKKHKLLDKYKKRLEENRNKLEYIRNNRVVVTEAYKELENLIKEQKRLRKLIAKKRQNQFVAGRLLSKPAPTVGKAKNAVATKLSDHFSYKKLYNVFSYFKAPFTDENFPNVLRASKLTSDDALHAYNAKDTINKLEQAITSYIDNVYNKKAIAQFEVGELNNAEDYQSLHRLLLEGTSGEYKLPQDVTTAIAVGMVDWLTNMRSSRSEFRNDDQIASFLGLTQGTYITEELIDRNNIADMLTNTAASGMGKVINSVIGLKAKKVDGVNTAIRLDKLTSELGLIGLATIAQIGYIKIDNTTKSDLYDGDVAGTIGTVKFTEKGNKLLDKNEKFKTVSPIVSKIVEADASVTEPRYDGPADPEREVKNSAFGDKFKTSELQQDAVRNAEQTAYYPINYFIDSVRDMASNQRDRLLKAFGFKDLETVHKDKRKSQTSKNNRLEKSLGFLFDMAEKMKDKSAMYFDYKLIATDRFYTITNTFNPQQDKLHRYAVSTDNVEVTANNYNNFVIQMAQAFGADIDKQMPETSIEQGKALTAMVGKMIKEGASDLDILEKFVGKDIKIGEDTFKPHTPSHTLLGIIEMRRILEHVVTTGSVKGYKTMLTIETDAVTSGHANKTMQIPLMEDIDKELMKVGVFTEAAKLPSKDKRPESFGELAEDPKFLDAYNDPASDMTAIMLSDNDKVLTNLNYGKQVKDKGANYEHLVKSVQFIKKVGIEADKDKEIEKIARSFMKDPFMTFGYGSALNSVVKHLGDKTADNFVDLLTPEDSEYALNILKSTRMLLGKKRADIAAIDKDIADINAIKNDAKKLLGYSPSEATKTAINDITQRVLGDALKATFEDKYGVNILAGRKINETFVMMARLMKAKLDAKIDEKELELGAIPTDYQIKVRTTYKLRSSDAKPVDIRDEVVAELTKENTKDKKRVLLSDKQIEDLLGTMLDSMPAIRTALSHADDDVKLLVIGRGSRSIDSGKKYNENTTGKVTNIDSKAKAIGVPEVLRATNTLYGYEEAPNSGIVNSVQAIDAAHQSAVLAKFQVLGIQDAALFNINNVEEGGQTYNNATLDNAVNYSLTREILDAAIRVASEATPEEKAAVNRIYEDEFSAMNAERFANGQNLVPDKAMPSTGSILKGMNALRNSAETAREKVFNQNLIVEHMAYPGAAITRDVKYKRTPIEAPAGFEMYAEDKESTEIQDEFKRNQEKKLNKEVSNVAKVESYQEANQMEASGQYVYPDGFNIYRNPFRTKATNSRGVDVNNVTVVIPQDSFKYAADYYKEWLLNGLKSPKLAEVVADIPAGTREVLKAKRKAIIEAINNKDSDIRTKPMVAVVKDNKTFEKFNNPVKILAYLMLKKGAVLPSVADGSSEKVVNNRNKEETRTITEFVEPVSSESVVDKSTNLPQDDTSDVQSTTDLKKVGKVTLPTGEELPIWSAANLKTRGDGEANPAHIVAKFTRKPTPAVVISRDKSLWQSYMDEKKWNTPRKQSDGSYATAIDKDAFKTIKDLKQFVIQHEVTHYTLGKRKSNETIGEYETRVNDEAARVLGLELYNDAPWDNIEGVQSTSTIETDMDEAPLNTRQELHKAVQQLTPEALSAYNLQTFKSDAEALKWIENNSGKEVGEDLFEDPVKVDNTVFFNKKNGQRIVQYYRIKSDEDIDKATRKARGQLSSVVKSISSRIQNTKDKQDMLDLLNFTEYPYKEEILNAFDKYADMQIELDEGDNPLKAGSKTLSEWRIFANMYYKVLKNYLELVRKAVDSIKGLQLHDGQLLKDKEYFAISADGVTDLTKETPKDSYDTMPQQNYYVEQSDDAIAQANESFDYTAWCFGG